MMTSIRFLPLAAILLLGGCEGYSHSKFAARCKSIAGIEVRNRTLWRQYLQERWLVLERQSDPTGVRKDSTRLHPVIATEHFEFTNDWVLQGRPSLPRDEPYRNDNYVLRRGTGETIARFRNLGLLAKSFEGTLGHDCTTDYPGLYIGGRSPW